MKYVWIVTPTKGIPLAFVEKDHIYASMDISYSARPQDTPKAEFISANEIVFSDGTKALRVMCFQSPTHL